MVQRETADASNEFGSDGRRNVLVDAVEEGGSREGASDTPNEYLHRVVAVAQPVALAEHVTHGKTGLQLRMSALAKEHIGSFLERENREKNSCVGRENAARGRLLAVHSHASIHLLHVPAHQNVVKPLGELANRSLSQTASLPPRTNDMDRFVLRVAGCPDPVAVARLGCPCARREFKGPAANRDDGRRKRVDSST